MKNKYKYDAFISYRHTDLDKFVAEKVHKYLESFKLPKSVKDKKQLNKTRIERVFRDKEELTITNNLEDPIIQALRDSEYLIVICSPRIKESIWCSKEIEKFIEFHGRNKILTVLIEGEPSESFPQELLYEKEVVIENGIETVHRKEIEPLAADVRANNKSKMCKLIKSELLRVIAPMFGLEYDDLRQRHRERRIKKIMTATVAAAALGLTIGVAGVLTALKINEQSKVIEKNNDLLLANQSVNLAEESKEMLEKDNRNAAISLAVDSLTEYDGMKLPYTAQGKYALTQSLRVYDTGEVIRAVQQFEAESNIIKSQVNTTGEYLMVWDNLEKLYVWNVEKNELIYNSEENSKCLYPTFVGSDKIAYVNDSGTMVLYDLKKNESVGNLEDLDILDINTDSAGKYIALEMFDEVCVYETEGLSSVYKRTISEEKSTCYNAFITENWLVYMEEKYTATEGNNGKETCRINFVDLESGSREFSVKTNYSILESAKYDDDKIYLSVNTQVDSGNGSLSAAMGIDTKTGKAAWEVEFKDEVIYKVRVVDISGKKYIATSSYANLVLINANTGAVEYEQTFSNGIVNYTNFSGSKCFVFDKKGEYIGVDVLTNDNKDMPYYFDCNVNTIDDFMICTKGYLVRTDNRVVLYYFNNNTDIKEYKGDTESFFDYPDTSEDAQEKAKELGAVNYKLAGSVIYSDDNSVAFVTYENYDIEIYNVEDKKLINKIEGISDYIVKYLGEDKDGNIYITGVLGGICLDKDYNLIAEIDQLLYMDKEKNTIIVGNIEELWEIPIYSTEDLVEKGKELLGN